MSESPDEIRILTTWRATFAAEGVDPLAATVDEVLAATLGMGGAAKVDVGEPLDAALELELGRKLGEGGQGVVHLARQRSLGREIAVKALKRPGDPEAVENFVREACVTGSLRHPNVAAVHFLARDAKGAPLVALRRLEGATWARRIREDPPSSPGALARHVEILRKVTDAVAFAHSRGVIHRDLKPDNVMVGAYGEVTVIDWGLAVSVDATSPGPAPPCASVTNPAGTPAYMAPEMVVGDGRLLVRATDVYLLGAILFELLTGRRPHAGASLLAVLRAAQTNALFPIVPSFDAPAELAAIATRCLATRPEDRFASALELRESLERHVTGEARREDALRLLARAEEALAATPAPPEARPGSPASYLAATAYGRLLKADALARAALERWPSCEPAVKARSRAHEALVRCALAAGDTELAAALLDRARADGESWAPALAPLLEQRRRDVAPEGIVALETARGRLLAVHALAVLVLVAVLLWFGVDLLPRALPDEAAIHEARLALAAGFPLLGLSVLGLAVGLADRRGRRRAIALEGALVLAYSGLVAWGLGSEEPRAFLLAAPLLAHATTLVALARRQVFALLPEEPLPTVGLLDRLWPRAVADPAPLLAAARVASTREDLRRALEVAAREPASASHGGPASGTRERAAALEALAALDFLLPRSRGLYARAVATRRRLGDERALARTLRDAGLNAAAHARPALEHLREALALTRRLEGDDAARALALDLVRHLRWLASRRPGKAALALLETARELVDGAADLEDEPEVALLDEQRASLADDPARRIAALTRALAVHDASAGRLGPDSLRVASGLRSLGVLKEDRLSEARTAPSDLAPLPIASSTFVDRNGYPRVAERLLT